MKTFFIVIFSALGAYCVALWKDVRVLGATIGILLQIAIAGVYYLHISFNLNSPLLMVEAFVGSWLLMVICLIAWGIKDKTVIKGDKQIAVLEKKSSWADKK